MPNLQEVVWCQEEPRNNGSWFFVESYIEDALRAGGKSFRPIYAGRTASASPATGLAKRHLAEQTALIAAALGTGDAAPAAADAAQDTVRHAGKANA
jgi:2-oxoglutarate dehydrogenase E1 component